MRPGWGSWFAPADEGVGIAGPPACPPCPAGWQSEGQLSDVERAEWGDACSHRLRINHCLHFLTPNPFYQGTWGKENIFKLVMSLTKTWISFRGQTKPVRVPLIRMKMDAAILRAAS